MDGGLDGAVLPLHQAIGPRMLCADEAVVDSIGLHVLVKLPAVLTAMIGSDHAGQNKPVRGVLVEPRGCVMRSESRYAPYLNPSCEGIHHYNHPLGAIRGRQHQTYNGVNRPNTKRPGPLLCGDQVWG